MSNGQPAHHAQKTLADFRDHPARHDKPIAFFFGVGTSCAVQVPSSADNSKSEPLKYCQVAESRMASRPRSWQNLRMRKKTSLYSGLRFPAEIISHAVWLYYRFSLSCRRLS